MLWSIQFTLVTLHLWHYGSFNFLQTGQEIKYEEGFLNIADQNYLDKIDVQTMYKIGRMGSEKNLQYI